MKNNKENDKKIYILFIVVMAALCGAGFLAGRFVARSEDSGSLGAVLEVLRNCFVTIVPPLYLVLALASLIAVCILYMSCKRMHQKLQNNSENDDLWDSLEEKLNQPMILSNVMQIVNMFLFACMVCIAEFHFYGKNGGYETIIVMVDLFLFLVILVEGMLVPNGIVTIEKQLNPEKQGNVFDFKFNEVWLSSCDEAQKLITYKAAYKAFLNTNNTCLVLCILSFMGMFVFKTGIYPTLCVCTIWLVNNVSYMLRAAKLERGK